MDVILPLLAIAVVVLCIVAAVHATRDDAEEARGNKAIFEAEEAKRAANFGVPYDKRPAVDEDEGSRRSRQGS
jgi:hypothetical protein